MKAKFIGILLAITVIFIFSVPAYAQDATASPDPTFNYDRAYQDYVFTLDQYNNAHSDYQLAKAQYLQAGTLVAQTKARDATAKMLELRDETMKTYLTAVRMKLDEAEGIPDTTKNGLLTRIDAEVQWFSDHKSSLSSAGTLDDLASDSDNAYDRFTNVTQGVAYEALATVPFGQLSSMRSQTSSILTALKDKIAQVRSDNTKDTSILERWAQEIDDKITRSLDKEIEAQALISGFSDPKTVKNAAQAQNKQQSIYNDVIFKLDESRQYLRDASGFMKEIYREIVTV